MINPHDLPNFNKGDTLFASDLQAMRNAILQSMIPGSFVMPGMVLQRRTNNGSTNVLASFALCTDPADPDGDGYCVYLNSDLDPVDEQGHVIGPDEYAANQFVFRNVQKNLGVPTDARIALTELVTAEGPKFFGYCIDPADALSTAPGDNPGGLLGGAGVKAVEWSGVTC